MAGSKMLMGWLATGLLGACFIFASGDSSAHPRANFKGTRYERRTGEAQALGSDQVSEVEYADGPLAPLYDFLIQRRLQRFCKLLRDANLEQVIKDLGGSWTLFAPNDASFIFLPGGTLDELQRNPQLLRDFILYHFVAGDFPFSQIQNEMLVDSVQGSPLRFNLYGQIVTVSGAEILEPDLVFEMGRVYIIDRPLYPIPSMDIITYLQRNYKEVYRLLVDAGLVDYLSSGTFTFLVPDDQAFGYLSVEFKDALKTNTSLAERILFNHILPGSVYVGGITDGMQWETVGGNLITFTVKRGLTFANDIPIVLPDVPLTNGVIHVLNRVLLPDGVDADCHCKPSSEAGQKPNQISGSFGSSLGQRPQNSQGATTRRPGQSIGRQTPRPIGRQPQGPSGSSWQPDQMGRPTPRPIGGQPQGPADSSWQPNQTGRQTSRPTWGQPQGPADNSWQPDQMGRPTPRPIGGQQQGPTDSSWQPDQTGRQTPRPTGEQQQGPGDSSWQPDQAGRQTPRPIWGQPQGPADNSWQPDQTGRQTPRPIWGQPQGSTESSLQPGQINSQGRPQGPEVPSGNTGSRPWGPSRTGQPVRPISGPSQATRSPHLPQPTQPPSDDDINTVIGAGGQPDAGQKRPDQTRTTRYPPLPPPAQRQRPSSPNIGSQPQDQSPPGSSDESYPGQGVTPGVIQTTRQGDRWSNRQRTPAPRYPTPQRGSYGTPTTRQPQTTRTYDRNQPRVTQPSLEEPNKAAAGDSTAPNQGHGSQTQKPAIQTTSWQQRNQIVQTTRQPYQPPRQPQQPQRRTTSRPSYGRTTVSPQVPSNEQSFESKRQQPNCRRQGDRITPSNQNLPICSASTPEGCQNSPYDPSDPRPLCPESDAKNCRDPNGPYDPSDNRPLCPSSGSPQDCREFGQPTYIGDRRPLCAPSSVPQTGCRDPTAPYNPSDRRPVCPTADTQATPSQPSQGINTPQGCRKPDEVADPQDQRPVCREETKEDCRPFLERPQPGDRRPVCKVRQPSGHKPTKDADKTQKDPNKPQQQPSYPQRGQYPTQTTRRQSWQSTTRSSQSWQSTRAPQSWQSTTRAPQSRQTTQQPTGKQPQPGSNQTPSGPGDNSFQNQPQTGSHQTGTYPSGPQTGKIPSQPQSETDPSKAQSGIDTQPESGVDIQPQTGSYPSQPQSGRYPSQPQSSGRPVPPQSGSYPSQQQSGRYPSQPQSGTHPSQQQSGSYPSQPQTGSHPSQPQTGTHPSHPSSGSYPSQQPGGPQSGSYPSQQPGGPQSGSYPSQQPGSPQSGSHPSQPQTGSYPSQQPGSPQSGSYPSRPQTGSRPSHQPGSPQSGSYPSQPQTGSYPSGRPGSTHPSGSHPSQPGSPQSGSYPSQPQTDSQPSQHPGSPQSSSFPSQPQTGIQPGQQPGSPNLGRPVPGRGQSQPGRPTPGYPQRRPGSHPGSSITSTSQPQNPGSRWSATTTRVPISVTGTSTPGEDTRRTLYEIVEDPALLIRGRPVHLTRIFGLFQKAGIQDILNEPGSTTVFLPSDDAFSLLPKGVVEQLEENPELLRQILLYHVTKSEILPSAEAESYTVPSVEGNRLVITMLNGGRLIFISGAKAVAVTRANNGIFYVINQLLYPLPHHDIVGAIQSRPDLTTLAFLLPLSGLEEMLRGQTPYTFLAPTDNAFSQLPQPVYEELTKNATALQEILLNHVIEGAHYGREFFTGGTFPSARGGKLKFQVVSYGYQVNEVNIKTPEIVTGSGVIHLVDQILLEEPDLKFFTSLENSVAGEDGAITDTQQPSVGRQQPGLSGQPGRPSDPRFPGSHQTGSGQPQVGGQGQQTVLGRIPPSGQGTFGNQPTSPGHSQRPASGGHRQPGTGQQTPGTTSFGGPRHQPSTQGHGRQPVSQPGQQTQGQSGHATLGGQRVSSHGQRTHTTSFVHQRQPGGPTASGEYQGAFQSGGQANDVAHLARTMGLNQFANWVTNTGLLEKIHDGGVYTVFAPTDEAVDSLPQEMAHSIQSNPEQVKSILQYHIVPQRLNLNSITNEETASTLLQGKRIRFNVYQNSQPDCRQLVTASGTPLGESLATMGTIQVIPVTQVLYQPSGNLLNIIEASPILQKLNEAVTSARLTWVLTGNGPMTIFAPSDTAFQSLTEEQRKTMIEDKQAFSDLLKRHIVRGTFFSSGIQDDVEKKSENNKSMKLSLQEGILTINSVPVTYSDITATNGVLHVIDHFL